MSLIATPASDASVNVYGARPATPRTAFTACRSCSRFVALMIVIPAINGSSVNPIVVARSELLNADGLPLPSTARTLYTYAAFSETALSIYGDVAGELRSTNPD